MKIIANQQKTTSVFDNKNNYKEYESKGFKNKKIKNQLKNVFV